MQRAKKIFVSVSSDLSTDQRVQKTCRSLVKGGYSVELIGRRLPSSKPLKNEIFRQYRLNLPFTKGAAFYATFNIALFIRLLFSKVDILYANDLDTLPANYLIAKLKQIPLIYDSHEYFTEVPELQKRKKVKKIWERIEKRILPNLKYAITVSKRIAEAYQSKYGLKMRLVRNFPNKEEATIVQTKKRQIIYQGALNLGRGLEDLLQAMPFVENAYLVIAGGGDLEEQLKELRDRLELQEEVQFLGRVDPIDLKKQTQKSMLGVSLEKDLGLNYRFALPNKLFDYLQAATPILYANLVEFKDLIQGVAVGEELESRKPELLAKQINRMLDSISQKEWQANCLKLAEVYTWEKEEVVLLKLLKEVEQNA
ncbi:MAG: glycosyltransferase [Vicingaceae bacterium]